MKFITSSIICLLISCQCVFAQNQETAEKENKLSIGLMGGVSTGHLNIGSYIEAEYKNFDVSEQLNSTAGFNIRYAATNDIALQSNIMLGKFALLSDYYHQEALSFRNNYITTSITTQLSLIRMLGMKSEYVNFYGSFGGGLMINDVSVSTTSDEIASRGITPSDHPSSTFFSTFGGGIRFNLGYRLDSFAQYDYHSASRDIIDGNFIGDLLAVNGAAETANSWSTVTVGLQYKFGSGNSDADWPGVAMRPVTPATTPERDVFEQLEDMLTRQADYYEREMEQLANQVEALQAQLEEERRLREEREQEEKEQEEDPYAAILREMQSRIDSLEKALAEERRIAEPPVGQEDELEAIAEAEEEIVEEETPIVYEDVDIDVNHIQPQIIGTEVSDAKPLPILFQPKSLSPITMEDVMQLIPVPEEEVITEAEVAELEEEVAVEEKIADVPTEIIEEEEITIAKAEGIEEVDAAALEEEVIVTDATGEEEVSTEVIEEEVAPEVTFDEIMEFARSILIEETIIAGDEEDEEEVIAEVYEEITRRQPEIRLLADSLTIINALNELKRGLEEDSTITISEVPDTEIETPQPEPKEVKIDETLAEMLDERALKTGGTPDLTEDDLIVEHPVEEYLEGQTDSPDISAEEPLAGAVDVEEEELADTDVPVVEEAPEVDAPEDAQVTDDQMESETDAPDSERSNWPLFALIAALFAGLLFYFSKFFKTEKDEDE